MLPTLSRMKIKSASFVTSARGLEDCPVWERPEFAFIGRSNVGKSSMINLLARKDALAKVSATPGKTRLLNFFLMNDSWSLVDLPGYGFAKAARSEKFDFNEMAGDYLEQRAALQVSDLKVPRGNRLHARKGDRAGQHAISVNDPWRICFRFEDGDAYEVECCDYR